MIKTLPEVLTLDRPMLGLDLETTGVNAQRDRIVEIGLEIMSPGQPTKEYRTLINPGCAIPPGATAVHKITDAMVASAPRFGQLAANLLKGFAGADFAGYNVRFDLQLVQAELKRAGHTWDYESARVLDGFRLWQVAEGRSLSHAVERWLDKERTSAAAALVPGESLPHRSSEAHNALYDVKMATRVIAAQILEYPNLLPRDVQKLHELCSPGYYDAEGKIQWREGAWRLMFGEHRNKPLRDVPKGYFKWMISKDFSDKVKRALEAILAGDSIPSPAIVEDADDADA